MGVTANGYVVSLWSKGNIPEPDNGRGWHHAVMCYVPLLCTFKGQILWFTCVESEAKSPRHQSLL